MWRMCIIIGYLSVAMVTGVLSGVPEDPTGYSGLFCSKEEEVFNKQVYFDNELPSWLTGTLIRNGPGLFEKGRRSVSHIFDGLAKLVSWKFFPNGTAFFSTRFLRSKVYKKTMQRKTVQPYILFAPPKPKFKPFQKARCFLNGIDNLNVHIYDFHSNRVGRTYGVFGDYWATYRISPSDLSTVKYIKPKLGNLDLAYLDMLSTAHPLPEPGTNNRLTFLVRNAMSRFQKNRLLLVRMSSISERSVVAEWRTKHDIPYMHSFSVTQTKAIMLASPYMADSRCVLKEAAALPCMNWFQNEPSVLYVVELKTGKKFVLKMPALFAMHHINAYDVNDHEIIMDVSSYDDPDSVNKALLIDVIRNPDKRKEMYAPANNKRVRIDLAQKKVTILDMSTVDHRVTDGVDMPAINQNFRSVRYCFVYGPMNFADGERFESAAILKKNMCDGGRVVGSLTVPSHYPHEPVFVPDPRGVAEDDGVLLVPFLRGKDAVTYLAIVDAKTMTITSKADVPLSVPLTFHGTFFKDVY